MFPATLFDYNGVLVDDEVVHLEAFRDVLHPLGIALSELDYWDRYLGFDDAGAFEAILRDNGHPVTPDRVGELVEAKRPFYLARARAGLRPFDGAAALVTARAAAGPVVVVSGALREEIRLGLEVLGVTSAISAVVAAEDTRRSKPDPEGYRKGIAHLEALIGPRGAQRAVVVEDSLSGIEAAKATGLACVAVAHSYGADALRSAGADAVFRHIKDVSDTALSQLYERLHG